MTDFIHEHPKDPPSPPPCKDDQEEEVSDKVRQKRVYSYALVLFTVAFALILWTFLMNQRSHQEVITELRGSNNILQSTLEENTTLETRVAELEKIVQDLRDELSITQTNLENAQSSLQQMQEDIQNDHRTITAQDLLRELQVAYTDGRLDEARSIATLMQDMNLVSMLPSQSLHSNPDGSEAAAPADVFEEIVQALQSEE